jgi:hypothetical protein
MNNITFEKALITLCIGAVIAGYGGMALTVAALGLMTLDGFKRVIEHNNQKTKALDAIKGFETKLNAVEKTLSDRMATVDNKFAALGIIKR